MKLQRDQVPGLRDQSRARPPLKSFKELLVWQKAMDLVIATYELTAGFPKKEMFGLTSQSRRCAVSIASNIAEGHSHRSLKAYLNFLSIARGSLSELETQLEIGSRLLYLNNAPYQDWKNRAAEVGRMLNGLRNALECRASAF